jgi:hypothetical protein
METKKESQEKSRLPTAALPNAMNGNFGTSPLEKGPSNYLAA